MTNTPIGIPSGWEEIAAWVAYAYEIPWENVAILSLSIWVCGDWHAVNHDWRVVE